MSDVLAIGGGILGLLTARELADAGCRVVLIERGHTGRESSWAGGGILSPLYPWRYPEAVTALAGWSQAVYPALCAQLLAETGVDAELIPSGLLILGADDAQAALDWAQARGIAMEWVDPRAARRLEPGLGETPRQVLSLPQVAQVRNPRLLRALRQSLEGRVEVVEGEEVLDLLFAQDGRRVCGVRTRLGERRAERVLVCAGAWTAGILKGLGHRPEIEPVRGQMILLLTRPGLLRHMVLFQDRYAIPRRDGSVLVGSTLERAGFEKATTAEAFQGLRAVAGDLLPALRHATVGAHWAGLRPSSPNGIPYIGPHPEIEGLYVNAGQFRNGLVTGPASARLAADLILGRPPILDPTPYALDASRGAEGTGTPALGATHDG